VQLRTSARARRLRLVVSPRRPPELVVPARTPRAAVDDFLAERTEWLERSLAWAERVAARPKALDLARPRTAWLAGEPVPVVVRPGARADFDGMRVVVSGAAALERWYRRGARAALEESIARQGAEADLVPSALSVRDQRTRWGSCSARGDLSFSWRLALAPPEVLDYVVAHELCHLRRRDHSRAFWRLVAELRPTWKEEERWLREHGEELHAFDVRRAVDDF
jgi:hypothetical protein